MESGRPGRIPDERDGFRRQVASSRAFGRASRPPQPIKTAAELKQRVAASERAIALVAASELDETLKPLSIDGKSPKEGDYPIQASTLSKPAKENEGVRRSKFNLT